MSAQLYAKPNGKPMRGPKDQQWDRTGRLVQVLWLLAQAGPGGLTTTELATTLPVSSRTVLRDIDSLENARIPVIRTWSESGRYHFTRRFSLELDARQRAAAAAMAAALGDLT